MRRSFHPRACVAALALAAVLAVPGAGSQGADAPSPEYRASLRRTLELRKQRRRAAAPGPAVGTIAGYPMPPSLIIRQTPEVHDEVGALLDLLRSGGR